MLQVHVPAGSVSPEFDAAFANEAETMFAFGQDPSSLANSIDQLQRRLRLSDVGLEHALATQMQPEDAVTIKVWAILHDRCASDPVFPNAGRQPRSCT